MRSLFAILVFAIATLTAATDPTDDDLRKLPIAVGNGPVPEQLRIWYKDGTAAGNVGDWYDNRDEGHSDLDMKPYPQLRRFVYTKDDLKAKRNWAAANTVRPIVVFGNSSTSAAAENGGSNVRSTYLHPRGLPFLYEQYTHNNIYIYPEHRDHDPGHNGVGDGYGDLYPTNTPYLLTSQGSSGSDQPFMHAIPHSLAAFRPAVKKKLVESGLLMPTVQMLLRSSNKHLTDSKEYLTGKAHPTVFEGSWVDELKMIRRAHDITVDDIPPLVKLKVVDETSAVLGRDYFDLPYMTEKLADTPSVIARIWRGKERERRLVVSAEDSLDLNKKPLTYRWVLLRGDPARAAIKPRGDGSSAELVVTYQERRPIAPGSAMESNRVDVGVFATNGVHYSAPAFITFYTLDRESRTYDDKGRILEIAHGAGIVLRHVPNYPALLEKLSSGAAEALLPLSAEEREALGAAAKKLAPLEEAARKARERRQPTAKAREPANVAVRKAEEAMTKAKANGDERAIISRLELDLAEARKVLKQREDEFRAAERESDEADRRVSKLLDEKVPGLGDSPRHFIENLLLKSASDVDWWNHHLTTFSAAYEKAPAPQRNAVDAARRRLIEQGLLEKSETPKRLTFRPIRGEGPLGEQLTTWERTLLAHFQSVALAELILPGLVRIEFKPNFVDQRLTTIKTWRDVYHYDMAGKPAGWTRYDNGTVQDFTNDGLLVVSRDDRGRVTAARSVDYYLPPMQPGRIGFNPNALHWRRGTEIVHFEYDGDTVRVKNRESVEAEKIPDRK
jgi:hypothetical protein